MPTGTKIAAIVLVVLLGAAGLYFAFQSPSNTSKTNGKTNGLTAPEGGLGSATNGFGAPVTMPPAGAGSGSSQLEGLSRIGASGTGAQGTLGQPGTIAAGNTVPGGATTGAATGTQTGATTGTTGTAPAGALANGTRSATGFSNGNPVNSGTSTPGTSTPGTSNPGIGGTTTGTTGIGAPTGGTTAPGTSIGGNSTTGNSNLTGSAPGTSTPGTSTSSGSTTSAPSSSGTESTHVVAKGETMESIAKSIYGSSTKWQAIAKANPSVDPSRMKIGTKLRIPAAGASISGTETAAANNTGKPSTTKTASTTGASGNTGKTAVAAANGKGGSHTVAKGETMSSIARKYFGDSKFWKAIAKANPKVDANNLPVGTKLTIPAKTAVAGGENVER